MNESELKETLVLRYDDFHKGNLTYQISKRGPQYNRVLDKNGEPMAFITNADLKTDLEINAHMLNIEVMGVKVEIID